MKLCSMKPSWASAQHILYCIADGVAKLVESLGLLKLPMRVTFDDASLLYLRKIKVLGGDSPFLRGRLLISE